MANQLSLTVGQTIIAVNIKVTAAQLRAGFKRHARVVGIQVEGKTDVEIGEAVLKRFLREVAENAARDSQTESIAAYNVTIQEQIRSETELIDPEPLPFAAQAKRG